jgi:hypothetical protein
MLVEFFVVWNTALNDDDLLGTSNPFKHLVEDIYTGTRICDVHFKDSYRRGA